MLTLLFGVRIQVIKPTRRPPSSRGVPFGSAVTLSSSPWERKDRSVSLRKCWRSRPCGILVAAALPRHHSELGGAEVDGHAGLDREVGVVDHFFALVPGEAVARELGQGLPFPQPGARRRVRRCGRRDSHQRDEPGMRLTRVAICDLFPFPVMRSSSRNPRTARSP